MAATIFLVMVVLLLLGFPMMVPLLAGALIGVIQVSCFRSGGLCERNGEVPLPVVPS